MTVVSIEVGRSRPLWLDVPDPATVAKLKALLANGHFGAKVKRLECLHFRSVVVGQEGVSQESVQTLRTDSLLLPVPPTRLRIDGPPPVLCVLDQMLTSFVAPAVHSARVSVQHSSNKRSSRHSPRASVGRAAARASVGRNLMEDCPLLQREADKVLHLWFEELTPDDWFWQSHARDDRIRREFGTLHKQAEDGELGGWLNKPDTCLAYVVILDQFSRCIYGRNSTSKLEQTDEMALAAASLALQRGDDKHWPPGPKRSALYLPFMHSDNLEDNRRCVLLMREGLRRDGNQDQGLSGTKGLPFLQGAMAPRSPKHAFGTPRAPNADDDAGLSDNGSSSSWSEPDLVVPSYSAQQRRGSNGAGATQLHRPTGAATGHGCTGARASMSNEEAPSGTYNIKDAQSLPPLTWLSLNHDHAKLFRKMSLNSQTHQAYIRDKKDVNRTLRYQCLVCAITHEFKLNKCAAATGAEQQHAHT